MIDNCNLCGGKVKLLHPSQAYGKKYKHYSDSKTTPGTAISYIYRCMECKAQVGCHGDTKKPFGSLADKKTREARHYVHNLLDPIWKKEKDGDYKKGSKGKKRKYLYKLLSEHMNIPLEETHMGMFNIEQCRIAYKFFQEYKKKNNL